MSRFLKIILTLAILVVALLVLVVIRVITLDPNDYKEWIVARFEEQTGRTLSLEGDIGLELYPWLDLSLERVAVGNSADFGDTPMLQAETARVRLKTLPLLSRQYEVEAVQLRGVRVNLVVDEAGTGNWADLTGTSQPATAGSSGVGGLPLTRIIIGGVGVSDFSLRYEDQRSDVVYQLDNLEFSIGELVHGTPIDLSMALDAAASAPALSASVALAGTLIYDLDNQRYQLSPLQLTATLSGDTLPQEGTLIELSTAMDVDLREDSVVLNNLFLSGMDASLQAAVTGTDISSDQPQYQGEFALAGDDLSRLFAAAGVQQLASRLAALDDSSFQIAASGTVDYGAAGRVDIPSLSASMLDASLDGEIELSGVNSGSPDGRGRLSAVGPDLPLVVEVVGQLTGGSGSQLAVMGRELGELAEPDFTVDFEFAADSSEGTVQIPTLEARLLGADINGQLSGMNMDSDRPRFAGELNAEGSNLPLLLQIGALFQEGAESALYQVAEQLSQQGDGNFVINTRFDVDLAQGNIAVPELSAQALGMRLQGEIEATGMTGSAGRVNGDLSLQGSEIGPLLSALGQPELAQLVERASVTLQLSGGRSDLAVDPLRVDLVMSGPQIPGSPVNLLVDAATRINLDQESLAVDSFAVKGMGLDAVGQVSMRGPFDAPGFDGRLEVASFNPRVFLQQLNQSPPLTSDPSTLQRMALSSSFAGTLDSVTLEELTLSLDDTTVTGSVQVSNAEAVSASFELALDSFNLDRYLAPQNRDSASGAGSTEGTEIPVELLHNLDVQGQVQIQRLLLSGLQLTDLRLSMNASDGLVELAPVSTALYGGTLDASASLSVKGSQPLASLDIDLNEVDLEPLMFDFMDASYISGRGNVSLALNGSGADSSAIQRSLSGSGSLQLQDGVLRGVDVASVLRQLETMIRSRQPGNLERGDQTAFESFSGTLTIDDGVIATNDLLILSPGFQVTGRGTLLDLSDQSIAFNLATSVDEATATSSSTSTGADTTTGDEQQYDIGGYTLPIACSGTLSAPRCLPDAGEILRARVQRELQERVGDLLDRSLGIERPETETTETEDDQQSDDEPEPSLDNLRDEILNRALDRIFN